MINYPLIFAAMVFALAAYLVIGVVIATYAVWKLGWPEDKNTVLIAGIIWPLTLYIAYEDRNYEKGARKHAE